jgi:ABC-2 type transport system permease protein
MTDNAALIKKIYLPRELFPAASLVIALVNFLPQLVILTVVCAVVGIIVGWHLTVLSVLAVVVAVVITGVLALGLGLFFGAINVAFRDAQNFVEVILMIAMWASPVLYQATPIYDSGSWLAVVYRLNPLTAVVELMHYGFWAPVVTGTVPEGVGFTWYTLGALVISAIVLLIGQLVFRRLEGRFAQDL